MNTRNPYADRPVEWPLPRLLRHCRVEWRTLEQAASVFGVTPDAYQRALDFIAGHEAELDRQVAEMRRPAAELAANPGLVARHYDLLDILQRASSRRSDNPVPGPNVPLGELVDPVGERIRGSRFTILHVLGSLEFGYDHVAIAACDHLSPREILAAMDFIEQNYDAVHHAHLEIEARIAHASPLPDIDLKAATRQRLEARFRQKIRAEVDRARHPVGR